MFALRPGYMTHNSYLMSKILLYIKGCFQEYLLNLLFFFSLFFPPKSANATNFKFH